MGVVRNIISFVYPHIKEGFTTLSEEGQRREVDKILNDSQKIVRWQQDSIINLEELSRRFIGILNKDKVCLEGEVLGAPSFFNKPNGEEVLSIIVCTKDTKRDNRKKETTETIYKNRLLVTNAGLIEVVKKHMKNGTRVYIEGQAIERKQADLNGDEQKVKEIVLSGYNTVIVIL